MLEGIGDRVAYAPCIAYRLTRAALRVQYYINAVKWNIIVLGRMMGRWN